MSVNAPLHTPYDGSSRLFAIGLSPLDTSRWLEVDDLLGAYLKEKDRLYREIFDKVFMEEADTRDAQREVLDLVVGHLVERHPEIYRREGNAVVIDGLQRRVVLDDAAPLKAASLLAQEDFVMMRRSPQGWRLVAASLCFPSSWSLVEKFGHPLEEIHRPVPGFGQGTRMADLIRRIFDKLQVAHPVERMNWSIQGTPELYHPLAHARRIDRAEGRIRELSPAETAANAFVRVERQTLRKLERSGDILFSIRIHLDPIARLRAHPDRQRIARGFVAQLDALDAAQLAYKGLAQDRDRLIDALEAIEAT